MNKLEKLSSIQELVVLSLDLRKATTWNTKMIKEYACLTPHILPIVYFILGTFRAWMIDK